MILKRYLEDHKKPPSDLKSEEPVNNIVYNVQVEKINKSYKIHALLMGIFTLMRTTCEADRTMICVKNFLKSQTQTIHFL